MRNWYLCHHVNPRSRRSRGQRCHRDACDSNRLRHWYCTDEEQQGGEPHNPEAVAVEGTHQVAVDHPSLESSEHVVEVEVLVGGW